MLKNIDKNTLRNAAKHPSSRDPSCACAAFKVRSLRACAATRGGQFNARRETRSMTIVLFLFYYSFRVVIVSILNKLEISLLTSLIKPCEVQFYISSAKMKSVQKCVWLSTVKIGLFDFLVSNRIHLWVLSFSQKIYDTHIYADFQLIE